MTQREFPVMATGPGWMRKSEEDQWTRCLSSMGDGLLWVQDGLVYYNGIYLGAMEEQISERLVSFGSKAIFPRTREMIDLSYPPKGRKDSQAELPASAPEGEAWLIRQDSEDFWSPSEIWVRKDGAWVNLGPIIRPLEASVTLQDPVICSDTYVGEAAEMNCIWERDETIDFTALFREGDAVKISGCVWQPRNNETLIVREVRKNKLIFYENSFRLPSLGRYKITDPDGIAANSFIRIGGFAPLDLPGVVFRMPQAATQGQELWLEADGNLDAAAVVCKDAAGEVLWSYDLSAQGGNREDPEDPQLHPVTLVFEEEYVFPQEGSFAGYRETPLPGVTVARKWPEKLEGVFADNNRLWGWAGRTLRASKLGDPGNWDFFDGTAEDSWAVDIQWPGPITGGISAHGYPTFFLEDKRIRVYGSTPEAYQTSELDCIGVREGCGRSLCVVDGALYYVSREGVMRDDGSLPTPVSEALGPLRLEEAVGGGLGTLLLMAGRDADGRRHLLSYDTRSGVWIRESGEYVDDIAAAGGRLFAVTFRGSPPYGPFSVLRCMGGAPDWGDWTADGAGDFLLETNDYTMEQPNTKRVHRIQLRMLLEAETRCTVSIQYDEDGTWIPAARLLGDGKRRSVYLPILPRRCDRFRLRFEGRGAWRLESLALELRSGAPELRPGPRFR
jgi:hypothetical protein